MAIYDPMRPQIIGSEWAPVRQESVPLDFATELGYSFTVTGAATTSPRTAQWLISHVPTTKVRGQVPFVSIYRRDDVVNVGRVYRIIVPAQSAAVTGIAGETPTSVLDAISFPFDDDYVTLSSGNSNFVVFFNFVGAFDDIFNDRRILKVNLLYTASGPFNEFDNVTNGVFASLESNTAVWSYGLGSITGPLNQEDTAQISRVSLGDVNPFWSASLGPFGTADRYPWRAQEFDRMHGSTPVSSRFGVGIRGFNLPVTSQPIRIHYIALEIVVCEENRLWYGGRSMGDDATAANAFVNYSDTDNVINLLSTSFQATGTIPPGDYVATITLADAGDNFNRGDKPSVSSLRQKEELPHPGVQGILINKWLDPDGISEVNNSTLFAPQYEFAGDTPTSQPYDILPGIGIRGQVGALDLTAPHPYSIQIPANVLNDTIARQHIVNNSNDTQVFYPWVRFYARRFGTASRTLRIRALSGVPAVATISQEEFDALPEIVDGWREVTLRFDSNTPSFSNTGALSEWEWDTINGSVVPKDHWEVLGAYTGGLSDATATYGGQVAFATFHVITRPPGSETQNVGVDLTLMFSQDPPAVTGFGVEILSQPVSGIGLECATSPECIPTGISYHHLTWDPGNVVCDTFSRTVTGDWGSADTEQVYTNTGGNLAVDYYVENGKGIHLFSSGIGARRSQLLGVNIDDGHVTLSFTLNQMPVGDVIDIGVFVRATDTSNQYIIGASINTDGTINALIQSVIGGVTTTLSSVLIPDLTFIVDQEYNIHASFSNTLLQVRVYESGLVEPTVWHASASDATFTSGFVGTYTGVNSGYVGSYPVISSFDDINISDIMSYLTHYEIQRQDDVDTTWRTIMLSSNNCPVSFNDYEARVGIPSRYRIRALNLLRFEGPWSDTIESTLTIPGVFGVDDGNSVLIFTSNERQDGISNLAYVMTWDRSVEEGFAFPEADNVQFQAMYQRDFVVAFKPTERGGERFSRTLLVNNSAVPTNLIRDGFTSLRDMAWDDISYVCVRNELGDRWLANVNVPSGVIRRDRKLYLAQVNITEVTSTPSQVDPVSE